MVPTVWEIIFVSFTLISAQMVCAIMVARWRKLSPAGRTIIRDVVIITIYPILGKPVPWEFLFLVHAIAAPAHVASFIMHVMSKWLDRHVESLEDAVVELRWTKEVLLRLHPLQSSERCIEWLKSVDHLQLRLKEIKDGYYGCRMNIIKGRSFSSEAREELNRANDLLRQTDHLLHPQEHLRGTMDFYKKKVLDFMVDMSPKSGMLGIWGMGGVGKSSLLKLVCDSRSEYDGDASFKVMYVRAGIGCTVGQVQQAIATSMGLPLEDNETSQAKIIHDHLKDTSFLLMLDDLWGYIDLKAVGIPWPIGIYGHKGLERQTRRKVVLATRNMDLCQKMECLCGNTFQMECFYEEDAWRIYLPGLGDKLLQKKTSGKVVVDKLLLDKPSGHGVAMEGDGLLPEKPPGHVVAEEGDEMLLEKPSGHVVAVQGDELLQSGPVLADKLLMMTHIPKQEDSFSSEKPSSSSWTKEHWVRTQPYTVFDTRYPGMMYTYRRVALFIEARRSSLLAVWGKRGVGKTALLRLVRDSYTGNAYFDHIMLVGAGTGSMVNNVQHAIAINLGFNLDMMSSWDELSRSRYIFDRLRDRSYLLLLDDIREPLNLWSVGLPMLSSRHRVIFATRSRAACALMYCLQDDTIKMQCLGKVDAWNLFRDKVGPGIIDDNCQVIHHLAEQMVSMCGGLPLALCSLGRAMSNKTDPREWRTAYSQLTAMRLEPRTIDEKVADLILNPHLVPPAIDEQADTILSDEMIKSITTSGSGSDQPRNETRGRPIPAYYYYYPGYLSVYSYASSLVGPAACGAPRLVLEGGDASGGSGQGVILPAWMAT